MKCSICHKEGHRSNNAKFHPIKAIATSTASVEDLCDLSDKLATLNINPVSTSTSVSKSVDLKASVSTHVGMSNVFTDELRSTLNDNFTMAVKGYHLMNNDPIKEVVWESINAMVLNASGCNVDSQSSGSHKSGQDLSCSLGTFSNKSTQYGSNKKSFKISSYRLTTVCSDKTHGDINAIIAEIERRKNFTYYSIIVREESDTEFLYDWYLIPSDYPAFDPASYSWQHKLGKTKNKIGEVMGWETDNMDGSSMSITFSMSSQLWIDVHLTPDMNTFIIGSSRVTKGSSLNYIQLYKKQKQNENENENKIQNEIVVSL